MRDPQAKTVTISEKEYASLRRDSATLAALEAAGVDNWEWYSTALGTLEDEEEEEDDE